MGAIPDETEECCTITGDTDAVFPALTEGTHAAAYDALQLRLQADLRAWPLMQSSPSPQSPRMGHGWDKSG